VANDGETVKVHYHGTLDDGEVFDSSRDGEPLTFVVGSGQVIAGFDEAVKTLSVGETTKVSIAPGDAYGERQDDRVFEVPRKEAPDGVQPGHEIQLSGGSPAVITEVTDEIVRVDGNHPLAGETLTFEIELVSVQ